MGPQVESSKEIKELLEKQRVRHNVLIQAIRKFHTIAEEILEQGGETPPSKVSTNES